MNKHLKNKRMDIMQFLVSFNVNEKHFIMLVLVNQTAQYTYIHIKHIQQYR